MNRGTCLGLVVCLTLTCLGAATANSEPDPTLPAAKSPFLKRWAIVTDTRVRDSGLADLVFAELSKTDVDLVERAQLEKVAQELALTPLTDATEVTNRLHVGELLRADALVVLRLEEQDAGTVIRFVIAECKGGARLLIQDLPWDPKKTGEHAKAIASEVLRMRSRFPDGIKEVIGVTHFLSRSLTHEHDALQDGYGHLLQNALASFAGVAAIELEEARAIGQELALTKGPTELTRVVPLLVESEYRVERSEGDPAPRVNLSITITDARQKPRSVAVSKLSLADASRWVATTLPSEILHDTAHAQPLGIKEQVEMLRTRADAFARLGAWREALSLREAALLLEPNRADQRLLAISESAGFRSLENVKPAEMRPENPRFTSALAKRIESYETALDHLEYLIRNKLIDGPRAVEVFSGLSSMQFRGAIPAIPYRPGQDLWPAGREQIAAAEKHANRFLTEVYPIVLSLDQRIPANNPFTRLDFLNRWKDPLFQAATSPVDYAHRTPSDLAFIKQVLTEVMPDGLEITSQMEQFFEYGFRKNLRPGESQVKPYTITEKDWLQFLESLRDSKHQVASVLGRYGLIRCLYRESVYGVDFSDWQTLRDLTAKLLEDYKTLPYASPSNRSRQNEWFYTRISDIRGYAAGKIQPRPSTPVARKRDEQPTSDTGALRFESVRLSIQGINSETVPLGGHRWRRSSGWAGIERVTRCGDRLDAFWNGGVLLLMRQPGVLTETIVDPAVGIEDIVWDGERLWMATARGGIWILRTDGSVAVKVNSQHGLPTDEGHMVLYPLISGRVLVIGSFGEYHRAWCATVQWSEGKDSKPVFHIFHEATLVPASDTKDDSHLAFEPGWIHAYQGGDHVDPVLLIGRTGYRKRMARPLRINLRSLDVSVFDREMEPARDMTNDGYFSRKGALFEALGEVVCWAPPGQVWPDGQPSRRFCVDHPETNNGHAQGALSQHLLFHGGWLYVPGETWWRIDPERLVDERLVQWRLPMDLGSLRNFAVSAHYGLVAWDQQNFYRITVESK